MYTLVVYFAKQNTHTDTQHNEINNNIIWKKNSNEYLYNLQANFIVIQSTLLQKKKATKPV